MPEIACPLGEGTFMADNGIASSFSLDLGVGVLLSKIRRLTFVQAVKENCIMFSLTKVGQVVNDNAY